MVILPTIYLPFIVNILNVGNTFIDVQTKDELITFRIPIKNRNKRLANEFLYKVMKVFQSQLLGII